MNFLALQMKKIKDSTFYLINKNMFPTNMKTGFSLNEPNQPDKALLNRLQNLLIIFAEKSIILGAYYAKSSGRDNLSGMDTIYALQYLAHEFMNLDDLDNCLIEKEKDTESEDESEDESESEVLNSDDDIFCRATNEDPICKKMNDYHDNWSEWDPSDPIEIMLKDNINKTLQSIEE